MALSADQETAEHAMRIEQMQTTIDHSRLNMKKLESDMRWESRKFLVSLLLGTAAALGAGAAVGNYLGAQQGRQDALATKAEAAQTGAATKAEVAAMISLIEATKAEAATTRSLIEVLSKERQAPQIVYVLPNQPLPSLAQPPASHPPAP